MIIKELKLINFDKYFSSLKDRDARYDMTLNSKIDTVLNHAAVCCNISGLTILEFAFLKQMATSAVLTGIEVVDIPKDENNSFNKTLSNLSELSHLISEDDDCISTDFGLLPLLNNSCTGYFRFSGNSINNITGGKIVKYIRMNLDDSKALSDILRNDLLLALSDTMKNYYNDVDTLSESIAHYKFYSTSSSVTLLDMKYSTGILNFFNASDSDKMLGIEAMKELKSCNLPAKAIIDDVNISFIVQGPLSSLCLFAIYTNGVNLYDTDSLRLIMNGRDLLYPTELLSKYMHRIEDSIVAYSNERDVFIKDKKFTIEDIFATVPSNTLTRYMVNLSVRDAVNLLEDINEYGINDDKSIGMAYTQFYEICKDITNKTKLIVGKFFSD